MDSRDHEPQLLVHSWAESTKPDHSGRRYTPNRYHPGWEHWLAGRGYEMQSLNLDPIDQPSLQAQER